MPGSLRLRMLAGSAAWIALGLLLAGFAIIAVFTNVQEQHTAGHLDSTALRLVSRLGVDQSQASFESVVADPRYGAQYSGLYWLVEDLQSGDLVRSRSLWDANLVVPEGNGTFRIAGPSGQRLEALAREVTTDGQRFRVVVAEDMALREDIVAEFGRAIALSMVVLWLILTLSAWFLAWLGLRPFARLRQAVADVRLGRSHELATDFPEEVLPLVHEVNDLLKGREKSLQFARQRAADLAHGLKTPLAVLAATADRVRAAGDVELADTLRMISAEMDSSVQYQLKLARLRVRGEQEALSASLSTAVIRSVSVLRKISRDQDLHWAVEVDRQVDVDVDGHDLIELVGVLAENAAKWARSRVDISCRLAGAEAELQVGDDGPGFAEETIRQLGQRGRRLDETTPDTGLGLAIAHEIVGLNGGTMVLGASAGGGALVTVKLPASQTRSAAGTTPQP